MDSDDSENCYATMDGALRGLVSALAIYAAIGLVGYVLYLIFAD